MFKNERLTVWEYVSNGLQYIDLKTSPVVMVRIDSKNKKISIQDNGRGMDWEGLENFFIMHGENQDRREGRPGRGMFGTGKSAAFGIGDVLRITTTKDKKTSSVELTRDDLERVDSGEDVPVRAIYKDKDTNQPNGTLIEIEKIHLKSIDQSSIIEYIERHLAKWPKDVTVMVNNHQCEFIEPSIDREFTFEPSNDEKKLLGNATLIIKVSKSTLDSDLRGISIFSKGVWHETTSLGIDGKEMSEFIFGEIEVPTLEDDKSVPSPFDASRSMRLNPENQIVSAIYKFVSPLIEKVRKELVEEHKEEKASEEAKRLDEEASKIAKIINSDFDSFRNKLRKARAAMAGGGFDTGKNESRSGFDGQDDFLYGGLDPADITDENGDPGSSNGDGPIIDRPIDGAPRRLNPIVTPDNEGLVKGHAEGSGPSKRRRGGFQIEFINAGATSPRAKYESDRRTIFINLDHPQIASAKQGKTPEDPIFRRLTYEVAFTEYAIALASELNNHGEYIDPSDPIYDIRESINRVAIEAAGLYG
jgi:hypothetical protein